MTMKMRVSELVQPLLGLVLLIAIVLAVLAVMAPFLTAIIWAVKSSFRRFLPTASKI